jgi:hypothetical protein
VPLAGDDVFLWEHSVPWGHLFIDGRPGPSVSGPATGAAPFRLARGRHTMEYVATYFPTLRCVTSVPFDRDDTCPLDRALDGTFAASGTPLARVLDLRATIDRMESVQRARLLDATQAQLNALATALPPGTLAVGDHFLDAQGALQQVAPGGAARALAPQFHLASSVDYYLGAACVTLRSRTGLGKDYNAQGWALYAPVDLTWRYFTADGQVALDAGLSVRSEVAQPADSYRRGAGAERLARPGADLWETSRSRGMCHRPALPRNGPAHARADRHR